MTTTITNPFNVEFRDGRNCQLVVYNNRCIAKVTKDGTLMTHATEAVRAGNVLESLGLSKAMFLVETEEQLTGVLEWPALQMFDRLTVNLYFVPDQQWFIETLREAAPRLQHLTFLEITGPVPLKPLVAAEALDIFPNTPTLKMMGECRCDHD